MSGSLATMPFDPWPNSADFYLLRHGECDWNRRSLCVGQTDRPLTNLGRRQAEAAREAARKVAPTRIVHSSLLRATETARIIGQGLQCDLICEPDLREVCLGLKEGMPEGDPEDDFIGAWLAGEPIKGAEPFYVFQTRVVGALTRSFRHTGSTLIVAHWGVFAAVSRATNSALFDPEHCVIYRVRRSQSEWLMERG